MAAQYPELPYAVLVVFSNMKITRNATGFCDHDIASTIHVSMPAIAWSSLPLKSQVLAGPLDTTRSTSATLVCFRRSRLFLITRNRGVISKVHQCLDRQVPPWRMLAEVSSNGCSEPHGLVAPPTKANEVLQRSRCSFSSIVLSISCDPALVAPILPLTSGDTSLAAERKLGVWEQRRPIKALARALLKWMQWYLLSIRDVCICYRFCGAHQGFRVSDVI